MFECAPCKANVRPPQPWCDFASLFPGDEKNNDITYAVKDSKNSNRNCYAKCDASVWIRNCEHEVIEPLSAVVTGNIPKWLKGILLRNGPGNSKVGQYSYEHMFDSSALVHRFGISNGEVTYQRRFVQTEVYKRNMAAQRIVVNGFGTSATPDPCQSIFRRITTAFSEANLSDNSMISIYPFGDEFYTFAESPVMHRIDPNTLETMGRVEISKYINIVHHTSHPHVMANGTVYNVGLSVTPLGPRYNIVRFDPSRVTIDESEQEKELSMFDQATIVASVPSRWLLNPSYMHTFGVTENYFVIVEQPLAISVVAMMITQVKQQPMINSFKWHDNEDTPIHVISRETGQVVRTYVAETFFFLHIINQFETRDKEYIVLDICCYRNAEVLQAMYIDSLKNIRDDPAYVRMFRSRPLRFILPVKELHPDVPPEYNLITIDTVHQSIFQSVDNESVFSEGFRIISYSDNIESNNIEAAHKRFEHENVLQRKATAHRLPDGRVFVRPELLCNKGCETPRVNADFYDGKEYRYFYAISSDIDLDIPGAIIKVDTFQKTTVVWQEKDVYPGEPIFVAAPNGKKEDDGIVLSPLVWGEKYENRVGLLILDASTFTEIARATFDTPGPVPKCLHGWFSRNKQGTELKQDY